MNYFTKIKRLVRKLYTKLFKKERGSSIYINGNDEYYRAYYQMMKEREE